MRQDLVPLVGWNQLVVHHVADERSHQVRVVIGGAKRVRPRAGEVLVRDVEVRVRFLEVRQLLLVFGDAFEDRLDRRAMAASCKRLRQLVGIERHRARGRIGRERILVGLVDRLSLVNVHLALLLLLLRAGNLQRGELGAQLHLLL